MSVDFKLKAVEEALPAWKLLDDVIAGDLAIKKGGETYLPNPSTVEEPNADEVYKKYKSRASFYNATGHTLTGLVGAAFNKKPLISVPDGLTYVMQDIDGSGISVYQQSQAVLSGVLAKGRHGLLVDYPENASVASKADQALGNVRASVVRYEPESIFNWRTSKVGGVNILSLVVLSELYEEIDGFKSESKQQFRVLELVEGIYTVTLYRKNDKGKIAEHVSYQPRQGSGQVWAEIPFTFVGSENNDWRIDKSPMLDMALLNIKHYQLGADWYNALHWAGQPQPVISGLTEQWRDWLEQKGYTIGSRSVLPLPADSDFKFATVTSDVALKDEVLSIEDRMKALGARLIQPGKAVKTATEAQHENESEHSVLSLAAENVSSAYVQALKWMAIFQNVAGEVDYEINQEFVALKLTAQEIRELVGAWQSNVLPKSDLWNTLRKAGVIDGGKTDEDIKDELSGEEIGLELD